MTSSICKEKIPLADDAKWLLCKARFLKMTEILRKIISLLLIVIVFFDTSTLFSLELTRMMESSYNISSGDVISISVSPAEEFSREVSVSPDGTIDLPLLGNLKVSGMSTSSLEKLLTDKFSKYISSPKISVSIKRFSSYRVAIIGQIQRSGYFEYNEGMKILDLIALAGGPMDYADSKNIKVYRKSKDSNGNIKEEIFNLSMDSFFQGDLSKNIELTPGDIVYIPRQKFTTKTKWISDNIIPWTMLTSFAISIAIILSK